jgi:hypothetical protein
MPDLITPDEVRLAGDPNVTHHAVAGGGFLLQLPAGLTACHVERHRTRVQPAPHERHGDARAGHRRQDGG